MVHAYVPAFFFLLTKIPWERDLCYAYVPAGALWTYDTYHVICKQAESEPRKSVSGSRHLDMRNRLW
jgi:hypothetical protein